MKLGSRFLILLGLMIIFNATFAFAGVNEVLQSRSDYIKVWHDDVGIPHVVASTTYGVYYGYGYCLSRDRMFQLEILRRSTEGTLAEILGEKFVESDFMSRRDAVAFSDLEKGLKRSSDKFKKALNGFTAGINHAIEVARAGKMKMDPAFAKAGIKPTPFSKLQVLNIFAGTMAARYNDFSLELDNLHLLNSLVQKFGAKKASEIFEDVVFFYDPKVYTTLGNKPYFNPGFRFSPKSINRPDHTQPKYSPAETIKRRNKVLKAVGVPDKSGSYGVVLSKKSTGEEKAFLLGGPQMGYFKPSAVYSIGLHTPDFDVVGTTPVGYIFTMFAANRNIAFTATAGVGNVVDLIALRPSAKDKKLLRGPRTAVKMNKRLEQIYVKGKKKPVLREVISTELGPVVAIEKNVYYVKNRGWQGRVVDSYAGWFDSTFATNLDFWLKCSDRNALSINWLGADKAGNISYVHCGLGKSRKSLGDDRLPAAVPTKFPFPDRRLAGKNPETGFYANWNCPPVDGYRTGDMQGGWAADQRTRYLAEHVRLNKDLWSVDYLKTLDKDIAFTDQRAYFFKGLLVKLIDTYKLSPVAKKGFDFLNNWDCMRTDENGDGKFDHKGAGVFDKFWNDLYMAAFVETLGEFAWMPGSDSTWTQSSLLVQAILRNTTHDYLAGKNPRDFVTEIFIKSINELSADGFHIPEVDCPPMVFEGVNHIGAPTLTDAARCTPFMNRGTDIQIVELSPEGISIFGCMPPGNAAFGVNEVNQMKDFKEFKFKKRALSMKEVRDLRGRFMVIRPGLI